MRSDDAWLHLAVGRLIWARDALPATDPLLSTDTPAPWVLHSWFAELLFYGVMETGGLPALLGLRAALILATLGLLWALLRRLGAPAGLAALLAAAALLAPGIRPVLLRPLLFSHLLLLVFLWILVQVSRGKWRTRRLWTLPPLMVLWANLHAGHVVGVLLPALALAACLVWRWLSRGRERGTAPARGSGGGSGLLTLALVVPATAAASLVNPYGHRIWLYALGFASGGAYQGQVWEWVASSPVRDPALFVLLAAGWLACAVVLVRPDAGNHALPAHEATTSTHPQRGTAGSAGRAGQEHGRRHLLCRRTIPALLGLALGLMPLVASRFAFHGAVGATLGLALALRTLARRRNPRRPARAAAWGRCLARLFSAPTARIRRSRHQRVTRPSPPKSVPGLRRPETPNGGVEAGHGDGRDVPFAPPRWSVGDLAAGVLLAAALVHTVVREGGLAMDVDRRFFPVDAVRFMERHGLRGKILNYREWGGYLLWHRPGERVFVDGRVGVSAGLRIQRYAAVAEAHPGYGRLLDREGVDLVLMPYDLLRPAPDAAEQPMAHDRRWALVYFDDRALIYLRATPARARLVRQTAYRTLVPSSRQSPFRAGALAPAVEVELRRAMRTAPSARAAAPLAVLLLSQKRHPEAETILRRALALAPNNPAILNNLGVLRLRQSRLDEAEALFRRTLRLDPGHANARRNLKALRSRARGGS